jgi:hypothetical protein
MNAFLLLFIGAFCSIGYGRASVAGESAAKPRALIKKVLVLAWSKRYEQRSMYEKELAYRLNIKGYSATPSVRLLEGNESLPTREEVLDLLVSNGLDGVIVLVLKDVSQKEAYTQSTRYINDPYNPFYFNTFFQEYSMNYSMEYRIDRTVVIEARLFDLASEKLIFHTEEGMTNPESEEMLAGEITEKVSRSLRKSRLLEKSGGNK